ncbi:hypothetical protein BD626DRAFT_26162 [Schizophyllum amplum]|uniref:Uncharacterized protein n=1 Tax=Schizophyllum amplum TaxID=97359 RepID=A0A550CZQ7_9AGAR|nr:hypothetical protein BD626DRAFT_26162 [Auriculariopsis ampla]
MHQGGHYVDYVAGNGSTGAPVVASSHHKRFVSDTRYPYAHEGRSTAPAHQQIAPRQAHQPTFERRHVDRDEGFIWLSLLLPRNKRNRYLIRCAGAFPALVRSKEAKYLLLKDVISLCRDFKAGSTGYTYTTSQAATTDHEEKQAMRELSRECGIEVADDSDLLDKAFYYIVALAAVYHKAVDLDRAEEPFWPTFIGNGGAISKSAAIARIAIQSSPITRGKPIPEDFEKCIEMSTYVQLFQSDTV